jgi:hypothetical protein
MATLRTVLITTALALTAAGAHADSSLYIGAGVGRGHVSDIYHTGEIPGLAPFFHIDNATAWDAIIGWRPVKTFAVEANYIDLGSDTYHWNNGTVSFNAHAEAVYAIGFLPLPLPHLEAYGKAGLARWDLNGKEYFLAPRTDDATQFAWGAGMQLHYGRTAIRLEYDHLQLVQASDAYLYMLGVTYRLW